MFLQNIAIVILLMTSVLTTASTLHYKQRLKEIAMNKHINDKSTIALVRQITDLANDIRIATYPTECDDLTKEITGKDCDIGNYMEWAGPRLQKQVDELLILVNNEQ